MSTHSPTPSKRTDPRPNYSLLGIDQEGAHHIHDTKTHAVHVIRDGQRELVQDLGSKTIDRWMHYVADERGWGDRYLFDSMGDAFEDALEEVED